MADNITPQEVIHVLNDGKISFVLVGAYGLAGWMRHRATEDVDVIVAAKMVKKAVKLLLAAFPHLVAVDLEMVTRLKDSETEEVWIDVMKPLQPPYRDIFKHTVTIEAAGMRYRVPSLEMALVCKFAPMISMSRADERKMQDATDFMTIVNRNPDIDLEKLAKLGELVYPGGGKEVLNLVDRVRTGKKLRL